MQFLLIFNEKFNDNNNAAFFLSFYLFLSNLFILINGEYDIGVGIADVTGPITDINFVSNCGDDDDWLIDWSKLLFIYLFNC